MTPPDQPPAAPASAPPPPPGPAPAGTTTAAPPQLLRSARQKVVGGVCGGLGRYCDIDPVVFRIVIGVLSVTGGVGLIFYGFAWLLIPLEGEDENEARRLLSGRVDGATLIAVLLALIGCGLFLSMLSNGDTLSFAAMLSLAVVGSAVWSQRRRAAAPDGGPLHPAAVHTVAEAPPETKAPPAPGHSPSWWRDPIVKDGTTGLIPADYLWGPRDTADDQAPQERGPAAAARRHDARHGIGGLAFLLALLAGGLGTGLSWETHPLGTSLQIGLTAALGVLALGIVTGAFLSRARIGAGTVFLAVLTAGLLAAASAVPKDISTHWTRESWRPSSLAAVQPRYQLGSGVGTLDLGDLAVPAERTVRTSAEVGAGRLRVLVPPGVTVRVRAEAGLGDIRMPGETHHDVDISPGRSERRTLAPLAGSTPAGTLELRLRVGMGQVEVSRTAP